MENEKVFPHDDAVEKAIIGTLLTVKDALPVIRDYVTPECFYNITRREVYEAICAIDDRGETPTIVNVHDEAQKRNFSTTITPYMMAEMASTYLLQGVKEHCLILVKLLQRRKLILLGMKLQQEAFRYDIDPEELVSTTASEIDSMLDDAKTNVYTDKDVMENINIIVNRNQNTDNGCTEGQTLTGYSFIDSKGGLRASDLIIVAGDTSQGKSSFANSIAMRAIKDGKNIAFYSMEMTKEQLTSRMISSEAGVNSNRILYYRLEQHELQRVDEAIGTLYNSAGSIYFDDRSTINVEAMLTSIRSMKLKYNIDGAIIDYLQILNVNMKAANKEQAMGEVARMLKNLAKQLGIWIIALSQLNRNQEQPEPALSRLRDSGQIAEAADVVMLIYRPEVYERTYSGEFENVDTHNTAQINVAKGRNIGTGRFICGFEAGITKFYELDSVPRRMLDINVDDDAPF